MPGRSLKTALGAVSRCLCDHLDVARGKRDPLVPPARLHFVGKGDFITIGNEFFGYFKDLCGLQPEDRVLDVGCGIGRMARPLTGYLRGAGSYDGFDIVPEGIKWCARNITKRYPGFRFQLADVHNAAYHPQGRYPAADFRFPYPDRSFDFVFLVSVFTHMLPPDLTNYLGEVARVLAPGKTCFVTYFLLNDESRRCLAGGSSALDFRFHGEGFLTINEGTPEQAVAYEEGFVRDLYRERGLRITEPIRYGSWSGRENGMTHQDVVIATRE